MAQANGDLNHPQLLEKFIRILYGYREPIPQYWGREQIMQEWFEAGGLLLALLLAGACVTFLIGQCFYLLFIK